MKYEKFLKEVRVKNEYFRRGEIEILYECSKDKVIVQDNYGVMISRMEHLLNNTRPKISSAIDKTEYFKNLLYSKNENYRKSVFKITGEYKSMQSKIRTCDKFGECEVSCTDLMKGYTPCIRSAIDKQEYFKNKVFYLNKYYAKGEFVITGKFTGTHKKIEIEDKYGKLYIVSSNLYLNYRPSVLNAIDKKEYLKNKGISVNKRSKISKFKKRIFYSLKFESDKELFFKIGITVDLKKRLRNFPKKYNIKIMYDEEMGYVDSKELEQRFLKEFKNFKYVPLINFSGHTECLLTDPISEYMSYF